MRRLWEVRRARHGSPREFGHSHAVPHIGTRCALQVLRLESSSSTMSTRAHLWLRVFGLAVILAAEFGPRAARLWGPDGAGASNATIAGSFAHRVGPDRGRTHPESPKATIA